jgi:hypothetical protein
MFSEHTLNVTFHRESGAAFYRLKSIKNLAFEVEQSSDKTATLYYCTVTYQYRNGIVTKDQTYTFCVYPRVGEIVS